jgi:AraC family transcriptional regulator
MVCNRCIIVVEQELEKLNIQYVSVALGEIVLVHEITKIQHSDFKERLSLLGFELLDDAKTQLIEKIKTIIIEEVHHSAIKEAHNFSEILSSKLKKEYSYLSGLFSSVEGITIEKYTIHHKIEKAKELLVYNELTLSEISYRLGYSSVAHLSNQFKKITGLTPSHFKKLRGNRRKFLDKV